MSISLVKLLDRGLDEELEKRNRIQRTGHRHTEAVEGSDERMARIDLRHVQQPSERHLNVGRQRRDLQVRVGVRVVGVVVGRAVKRPRAARRQPARDAGQRSGLIPLIEDDLVVVGRAAGGALAQHRKNQPRAAAEIDRPRRHLRQRGGRIIDVDVARDQVRSLAREFGHDVLIEQGVPHLDDPQRQHQNKGHEEREFEQARAAVAAQARCHENFFSFFIDDCTLTLIWPPGKNGRMSGVISVHG